jgi:hypothetical protein
MTNDSSATQLLNTRFFEMPEEVKGLLVSNEIDETVTQLASDFTLNDRQSVSLSNEILLTLLFFCPVSDLRERIKTNLDLQEDVSEILFAFIYQKFFHPREYLYLMDDALLAGGGNVGQTRETKKDTFPDNSLPQKPVDTPPTNTQVMPLTTPQSSEFTHTSNQDDLLRRDPPPQPPQN